ncbi:hypothetical protein MTBBW1_1880037 [Desulfamplus magnetovallimortis]|uniref:Uncharacterized protein n=1 Tax=Desulfamplus magnetovallimortis TaxID=1246637 RepID=A0A1W1HAU3_9BACT|nr:hypothetical protein [Desulfamplus magnetovallimortis]SLM29600.1 hypothetical protein MTBBW1_1880037 [Desulfamplus magnetovallimortis]
MFPDRKLQLKILEKLKQSYPASVDISKLKESLYTHEDPDFNINLHYLHDHGLIRGDVDFFLFQITVSGIDLIADDGGLNAILKEKTGGF